MSLLQRRLSFHPAIVQRIGRAEGDQLDVLFGGGNVLRRVDYDVTVFPAMLGVERVSAKRINQVQPFIPKREALVALDVRTVEVLVRAGKELRQLVVLLPGCGRLELMVIASFEIALVGGILKKILAITQKS